RSAVGTTRDLAKVETNAPNFSEALLRIGRDEAHPAELRLEALAALPNGMRAVEPQLFSFLCANVAPSEPVMTRSAAANVLARAKLTNRQLLAVAHTIRTAGPVESTKLLAAFDDSTDETARFHL